MVCDNPVYGHKDSDKRSRMKSFEMNRSFANASDTIVVLVCANAFLFRVSFPILGRLVSSRKARGESRLAYEEV